MNIPLGLMSGHLVTTDLYPDTPPTPLTDVSIIDNYK